MKALVFTPDRRLAAPFARAVSEMPVNWVLLDDPIVPRQLIASEAFDLIIVDCKPEHGRSLLNQARSCELNHKAVIVAVTNKRVNSGLRMLGADEYIGSRNAPEQLPAIIKKSVPLIEGRRRSARRSIHLKAALQTRKGCLLATALTLSEGGMMLRLSGRVNQYEILLVDFLMPGSCKMMALHGKIVLKNKDTVGLRFLGLDDEQKRTISELGAVTPYFSHSNG